jgi:hypothetical protein
VVVGKLFRRVRLLGLVAMAAAGMASAAGSLDLYDAGVQPEAMGQSDTKPLVKGATYTASAFAVAVKIHPPDGLWAGVQHESQSDRWIQLSHLHTPNTAPLTGVGYITLESSKAAMPSAAQTLANLRATPHMSMGATKAVSIAGLRGQMFDATITGVDAGSDGITIAPFGKNLHCGFCTDTMHGETKDTKYAKKGQLFKIIVLNAHGKVVVIYIESTFPDQKKFPPAKLFPTFLPYAQKMLMSISFP